MMASWNALLAALEPTFITHPRKTETNSNTGDMATNGPYFSQLLLLVLYISGIRFTASLNEAEREAKAERFYEIFMGLLMVEMRRPTRITTIRESSSFGLVETNLGLKV